MFSLHCTKNIKLSIHFKRKKKPFKQNISCMILKGTDLHPKKQQLDTTCIKKRKNNFMFKM